MDQPPTLIGKKRLEKYYVFVARASAAGATQSNPWATAPDEVQ